MVSRIKVITVDQYLERFQSSVIFHMQMLFPGKTIEQLSQGERRELVDLVCEDVKRLLKLDAFSHAAFKEIAVKVTLKR